MNPTPIEIHAGAPAEAQVVAPAEVYVVAAPTVHTLDLERYGTRPRRPRGTYKLHTAEALVQYVQRHRVDQHHDGIGEPEIFADIDRARITAVLNPHDDEGRPGWGDWTAVLDLRQTPEWKAWAELDGKLVGQVDFAEHLEAHLDDIVEPPAADLLEIARTFEAKTDVAFRSAVTLESGARQFLYNEQTAARAGSEGKVTVPARFTVGIPPFDGTDRYRLEARLRYRITAGNLSIGFQLIRPDLVIRSAFLDVVGKIATGTEIDVHLGSLGG